jgi:hypothetical protein
MSAEDGLPTPRPSRERAAWLVHPVSSVGRLTIASSQYEELRAEALALKGEKDSVLAAGEELLRSLGEFTRQSMHANPEWKSGIEAMEKALFEAKKVKP